MLDVRKLQALQAVSRHGSIAAAARSLHFTAPAVSQQLAALERETQSELFVRTGRSIHLTDAGALLAAHADIVLAQLAAASAALTGSRPPAGVLRVAAFPTAITRVVAAALGDLTARHPAVDVRVQQAEPEEAERLLRAREIDVAIVHHYDLIPRVVPQAVDSEMLFDEAMVLALPAGRSWPKTVDLSSLQAERWVAPSAGTTCHEMVRRACGAAGFVPEVVAQCTDYASTLAIVRAGCGVALVPELALDADARDGIVIRHTVRPLRRYVSVQRPSGGDTTVAHLFVESLREAGLRVGAS